MKKRKLIDIMYDEEVAYQKLYPNNIFRYYEWDDNFEFRIN